MKTTWDKIGILRDLISDEQKELLDEINKEFTEEIGDLTEEIHSIEWKLTDAENDLSDAERKLWELDQKLDAVPEDDKIHSAYQIESLNSAIQDKLKTIGILKLTEIIEKL